MARTLIARDYTPAQERVLSVLDTHAWLTRAQIAAALGKGKLYPNEVAALTRLAERDVIDEDERLIDTGYAFFYRKR